jgi:hypothetical protein
LCSRSERHFLQVFVLYVFQIDDVHNNSDVAVSSSGCWRRSRLTKLVDVTCRGWLSLAVNNVQAARLCNSCTNIFGWQSLKTGRCFWGSMNKCYTLVRLHFQKVENLCQAVVELCQILASTPPVRAVRCWVSTGITSALTVAVRLLCRCKESRHN